MNSINDLLSKIDSLEKQITLVQNNVNFSLTLTWAILAVVVAIVGVAMYFLVKMWFNHRFAEEASKIDDKVKNFVVQNPQVFLEKGTGITVGTHIQDGSMRIDAYFGVKNNISKDLIIFSEFSLIKNGQKISIKEDEMNVRDKTILIRLTDPDKHKIVNCGDEIQFFIICENPLYKNLK